MNKKYEDIGYEKPFNWTSERIFKYLKSNNIKELEKLDKNDETAFLYSCHVKSTLALDFLKYKKINFNAKNAMGNTGLMIACWTHNHDIIMSLLKHPNVDKSIKNDEGWTAWDIAEKYSPDIFKIYKDFVENKKLNENFKLDSKKKKNKKIL